MLLMFQRYCLKTNSGLFVCCYFCCFLKIHFYFGGFVFSVYFSLCVHKSLQEVFRFQYQ